MNVSLPNLTGDQIATLSFFITILAGIAAWIRRIIKRLQPAWQRMKLMSEDWVGVPDRPGVKGRQGVMVQLTEVRAQLNDVRDIALDAQYHSKPNGGNSAYDKLTQKLDENSDDVKSVQADTSALIVTLAQHTNQLTAFGERMDASEKDREGIHREISVFKFGGTERQTS